MADGDDPVVLEYKVHLSKQLPNLILLQYPVLSTSKSLDHAEIDRARVKPKHHLVELHLGLDPDSQHYVQRRGEELAAASEDGAHIRDHKPLMDKMILKSVPSGADPARYAIGVLQGNECHLTPLSAVLQLRPSFNYLDAAEGKKSRMTTAESGFDEDAEDDAKQVRIRAETAEAKAQRMASFEHHQQQVDEEPWLECAYFPASSSSSKARQALLCSVAHEEDTQSPEFNLTAEAYQQILIPRMEVEAPASAAALPSDRLSLAALQVMNLSDRIRALMRVVRAMRFADLMTVLKSLGSASSAVLDAQDVVRLVQDYAVLIQGCWVVKSEVLYPAETASEVTGTPASVLCQARNYVLRCFVQGRPVMRNEITSAAAPARLAQEDERDILDKIARRSTLNKMRGWEFGLPQDTDFLCDDRFKKVIQRQEFQWQQMQCKLEQQKTVPSALLTSPKKRSPRGRTKSCGGEPSMSDVSDTDIDMQNATSVSTGGKVQTQTHGTAMPRNELHDPVQSALVAFAAEQLSARFVLSARSLRTQLDMMLSTAAAGHILGGGGITPQMFEQALVDAGATSINLHNSTSTQQQCVFLLTKCGDKLDIVRSVMIEMLTEKPSLRLASLRKKIEEQTETVEDAYMPTDLEIRAVLKNYCDTRAGGWHIKQTDS